MEVIAFVAFGVCICALIMGTSYAQHRRVGKLLDALWQELSARFNVPMNALKFDGRKKAELPLRQGTLFVSYPLSSLNQTANQIKKHLATIRCEGLGLPSWFEYSTRTSSSKGLSGELTWSSTSSLYCAGVDLSDHIPLVFQAMFEDPKDLVERLNSFNVAIASGHATFEGVYDMYTKPEEVVGHIETFVHTIEHVAQRLPAQWERGLVNILVHNDDSALFGALSEKLDLVGNTSSRALLVEMSPKASAQTLALWCAHGLLSLVRTVQIPLQTRRHVFACWAIIAPLAERSLAHARGRELVDYFCERETLASLDVVTLSATPELVLPLMLHFSAQEPEHVWEASKALTGLMQAAEVRAWLNHLEASGQPITSEHLVGMRMSDIMPTDLAQDLLTRIQTMASTDPLMMQDTQLNQHIAHLLKHVSDDAFEQTCQWLSHVGTSITMRSLRAQLDDHFSQRSSSARALQQTLERLAQRVGHAGGLSLSGEAQSGDVSFVFDEAAHTVPQKKHQ